jgi:peptidoglycan/xylan/chitin deacetylase (PgdA/CDA1 family)
MKNTFDPKRDRHIVVMYHYVFDEQPDRRGMHPRQLVDFERELDFLKEHYEIVSVPEVLAIARRNGPPVCALTFDDATRDQYENAAPRLEARGLRGTFFTITEVFAGRLPFTHQLHVLFSLLDSQTLVGRYHCFLQTNYPERELELKIPLTTHLNSFRQHDDIYTANFKERFLAAPPIICQQFLEQIFNELKLDAKKLAGELFMQLPEIKTLRRRGHIIGVHGCTHRPFDTLTLDEIKTELQQSISTLTESLAAPPAILSYPYGRLPIDLKSAWKLAQKLGLTHAVAMEYRSVDHRDDPFLIPRFNSNHIREFLLARH